MTSYCRRPESKGDYMIITKHMIDEYMNKVIITNEYISMLQAVLFVDGKRDKISFLHSDDIDEIRDYLDSICSFLGELENEIQHKQYNLNCERIFVCDNLKYEVLFKFLDNEKCFKLKDSEND